MNLDKCTRAHALACARYIKTKHPDCKVYVFGSVARCGCGRDIDLVIEVSSDQYESFQKECLLQGMHWTVKALEDPDYMYWSYFSPSLIRAGTALRILGFDGECKHEAEKLAQFAVVPSELIDIICLPRDWKEDLVLRNRIQREIPKTHDAYFMDKVAHEAEELIIV